MTIDASGRTLYYYGDVAPAIVVMKNKTFVVPQWLEVPEGTTLSDIIWSRMPVKSPTRPTEVSRIRIKGSRGEDYMLVTKDDGTKTCTCMGFCVRKTCKHVKA